MNNSVAVKLAASTLVLGMTMVGCTVSPEASRPASLSAKGPQTGQQAAAHYAQAEQALRQGKLTDALVHVEKAVELEPRDVGYRLSLADLYLKNGRFRSAATSFNDVLTLQPGHERAALSLALTQIALGNRYQATTQLDQLAETAKPGDVGLAYALAGETDRAIALLEPAARAPGADARVRQNLALAYALAGDWLKARTTAAQDVSPAQIDERMAQWAAMANPEASWTQVASLLGVTPVQDPGQPVRLALAPQADDVRLVEAAEVPVIAAEPKPTEVAFAPTPEPEEAIVSAPVPVATPESRFAEAVQTLVEPQGDVAAERAPVIRATMSTFEPAKKAPRIVGRTERQEEVRAALGARPSRFVVQLGAFSTPDNVERAWVKAIDRYPAAAERVPLSTTVTLPGRGTFHRLSVSGFDSRAEANGLCASIRAKGGACFVRETAGDAPVRWASRYTRNG